MAALSLFLTIIFVVAATVTESLATRETNNGIVMLAPRFRFFPFHYYISPDKSQNNGSPRVRRANKLANMMRLGKRSEMITREQSSTNSVTTPWVYANVGTIPIPKPSYITSSSMVH